MSSNSGLLENCWKIFFLSKSVKIGGYKPIILETFRLCKIKTLNTFLEICNCVFKLCQKFAVSVKKTVCLQTLQAITLSILALNEYCSQY